MNYEDVVRKQIREWEKALLAPPGPLQKAAKAMSDKVNTFIPQKIHQAITSAVKGVVRTVLLGVEFTPKGPVSANLSLREMDRKAKLILSTYKKVAAAEGAGTGAGGFVLGAVDFPALIAIKMKFLFELAHIYGFNTRNSSERLYILQVFQLAFASREVRARVLAAIKQWDSTPTTTAWADNPQTIDWEQLQREYRDAIDFRKMLQLLPGIGAVVGAWANYGLLEELGETAINCYRMRHLLS
jgi:uncharacterized protein (DUF697 family)